MKQFIFIVVFQTAFVYSLFSQETRVGTNDLLNKNVTLSFHSLALDNAFDELSNQTGCYFTYNADQIDGNRLITVNIRSISLKDALDTLLNNPNVTYQLVNNQVVILPFIAYEENFNKKPTTPKILKGKVVDAITGEPLPFASLAIKNSYFGGITNEQGAFSISISDLFKTDTLVFSFMGYYNKEMPLTDLNAEIIVALDQGVVSIQEVIIRSVEPELLLKKARSLFRENYFDEAYNYEAFYREAVKKSSHYMVYSEALIEGYKPSFLLEHGNNKVQIKKSRKFTNIQLTDTLLIKLRGGVEACYQLDLINQLPDFLTDKGEELYYYSLSDIAIWQNELVYVINFKQREYVKEALFEGIIYVSVSRYAIIGVDFSFSKEKLRKTNNLFVVKKSRHVNIKPVSTAYQVEYANLNGKYFTKHVRGELVFKVKKGRNIFNESYSTLMEMVYTHIDTANINKKSIKDVFHTNTIFSDSEYVYDADFWDESNVITPEENILDAFKSSGYKVEQQDQFEN